MKRILLTGGSGFIGKNILESPLAKKYQIIAPSRLDLNLIDTDSVNAFFKSSGYFDVVLHCATKAGHRNAKDTTNLVYSNIRIFENLAYHTANYGKFINFGSGAIYNTSLTISGVNEDSLFKTIGIKDHDFCKYVIGKRIEALPNFIDLNIFGIFGKYEDWEIRFISNAICKAIYNLPITLKQNRLFSYLYIDDLMPILEFFIENTAKYKSYNITPNETSSLLDLARIIKDISQNNLEIQVGLDGMGLDYTGKNTRLHNEISNLSFTPTKLAIEKLYLHYQSVKATIDKSLLLADK